MPTSPPLRVGIVPYLNMLPLVNGMEELRGEPPGSRSLRVLSAAPSRMVSLMEAGELDLGMVPVAALFEHPEWRIVGRSMIGSEGPVLSVLAMAREPPQNWTLLHPDSHSRTSNVLIQILLSRLFGASPALGTPLPFEDWTPPEQSLPGEAFLLIGTRALRWRDHWKAQSRVVLDLGALWSEWTGLPFVYAVWAARPEIDTRAWMRRFETLKQENLKRLENIVETWPGLEQERLTPAEARDYLTRNILFDLEGRALRGLDRFYREGRDLNLFPPGWELAATLEPELAALLSDPPAPE